MIAAVLGVLVVIAAAVLFAGWCRAREAVRAAHTEPARREWVADAPDVPADMVAELAGLGYAPAGVLGERRGGKERRVPVFIHGELPIYALVVWVPRAGKDHRCCELLSFFQGGGRLGTYPYVTPEIIPPALPGAGPFLAQARWLGTPTALDGQHVGTVRAWMGGKRRPLPATREALFSYLEADDEERRRALEAGGWLTVGDYLRLLLGRPRGVLKF